MDNSLKDKISLAREQNHQVYDSGKNKGINEAEGNNSLNGLSFPVIIDTRYSDEKSLNNIGKFMMKNTTIQFTKIVCRLNEEIPYDFTIILGKNDNADITANWTCYLQLDNIYLEIGKEFIIDFINKKAYYKDEMGEIIAYNKTINWEDYENNKTEIDSVATNFGFSNEFVFDVYYKKTPKLKNISLQRSFKQVIFDDLYISKNFRLSGLTFIPYNFGIIDLETGVPLFEIVLPQKYNEGNDYKSIWGGRVVPFDSDKAELNFEDGMINIYKSGLNGEFGGVTGNCSTVNFGGEYGNIHSYVYDYNFSDIPSLNVDQINNTEWYLGYTNGNRFFTQKNVPYKDFELVNGDSLCWTYKNGQVYFVDYGGDLGGYPQDICFYIPINKSVTPHESYEMLSTCFYFLTMSQSDEIIDENVGNIFKLEDYGVIDYQRIYSLVFKSYNNASVSTEIGMHCKNSNGDIVAFYYFPVEMSSSEEFIINLKQKKAYYRDTITEQIRVYKDFNFDIINYHNGVFDSGSWEQISLCGVRCTINYLERGDLILEENAEYLKNAVSNRKLGLIPLYTENKEVFHEIVVE